MNHNISLYMLNIVHIALDDELTFYDNFAVSNFAYTEYMNKYNQ